MAEGGSIPKTKEEGHAAVIVSNVIDGVRQSFIDSGVDVDVLEKLQELWISKLAASTSQGLSVKDVRIPPSNRKKGETSTNKELILNKMIKIFQFQDLEQMEVSRFE